MNLFRARWSAAKDDDAGYVAVLAVCLIPVLIGLAALAVDVSYWYLTTNKEQKAADAAALAGAIYLPAHLDQAKAAALDVATKNGFTDGAVDDDGYVTNVTAELGDRPTQMRVIITQRVKNQFGSIFGAKLASTALTRDGVADYAGPLAMGSPCNVLGNEHMEQTADMVSSPSCADNDDYWINMAGGGTNKARGDAVGAFWCTTVANSAGVMDGCQKAGGAPATTLAANNFPSVCNSEAGLTNLCQAGAKPPQGYLYAVHLGASPPSDLQIQAYDAGFVYTGDKCDSNMDDTSGVTNYYVKTVSESKLRYTPKNSDGTTHRSCAGDNTGGAEYATDPPTTKYTIWSPSPSAADPLGGSQLCSVTIPGYGIDELKSPDTLKARLGDGGQDNVVAKYFHRWSSLCDGVSLGAPTANGNYIVQVQTYGKDGSLGGGGQNRFALRAFTGAGTNSSANSAISITALQHESLYFNFETTNTATFDIVRLPTGSGAHVLDVRYFDLGDASGTTVDVTLHPPKNSSLGSTAWNATGACTGVRNTGTSEVLTEALSNCQVSTTQSTHDGRWQIVKVALPANYTCNDDADYGKCWVQVTVHINAGTLADTTTWQASLDGDPVRLVPDSK